MTDDIVARLKKYLDGRPGVGGRTFDPLHPEMLIAECADEIERLRAALREYACNCPSGFCLAVGAENNDVCGDAARAALEGEKTDD